MGATHSTEETPAWEVAMNIAQFLPWEDRQALAAINKPYHALFTCESTWRFYCALLAAEHCIFVPRTPLNGSWRELFLHLFSFTSMAVLNPRSRAISDTAGAAAAAAEGEVRHFAVRVFARFRDAAVGEAGEAAATATIPIHQRLAMLRTVNKCSAKEAFRLLWAHNSSGESDPWEHAFVCEPCGDADHAHDGVHGKENGKTKSSPSKHGQAVRDAHARVGVLSMRPKQVVMCAPTIGVKSFKFEGVYAAQAPQDEVYEAARHLVGDFINGVNGCIMCYGQTGSGKTHTMFGPDDAASTSLRITPRSGIAPRALYDVFEEAEARRAYMDIDIGLTYVEVFGNEIADLLRDGAPIGPWHGIAARQVLEGVARIDVATMMDVELLLRRAEACKRRGSTAMNDRSSRAHSVLMLVMRQTHRVTGRTIMSRLCIADLGGSEQVKKSGVEGDQLVEAVNINLGLLALKSCITALRLRRTHVPFNDSVLTMLLEASLGGTSNTVIVVTGNTHPSHAAETVNALRFGEACRRIERDGVVQSEAASEAIDAINQELAELEAEIRRLERWETQVVVRQDEDGEERLLRTVPVGAEIPRARYEKLLAARSELLGM